MVKSNVHAVRRRKTNRRIALQYDAIQQQATRNYQQRNRSTRSTHIADGFNWAGFFRKTITHLRSTFSKFFRRFGGSLLSAMRHLDLRSGGLYGENLKRDAGAQQLRGWFPNLGRMTSMRDGRRV